MQPLQQVPVIYTSNPIYNLHSTLRFYSQEVVFLIWWDFIMTWIESRMFPHPTDISVT